MFFKTSDHKIKYANNAYWCTFVFWGGVLLINSFSQHFYDKRLLANDFLILIIGLNLFFIVHFLSKLLDALSSSNN